MPTVTSANKAEFDKAEMFRRGLLKEDNNHQEILNRMSKEVPEDVEHASFGHEGFVYHTPLRPIENAQQRMLGIKITPIHERAFKSDKPIHAHHVNKIEARPYSHEAIRHFAKELADAGVEGLMHKSNQKFSFVHESPKEKGKHQATEYDKSGAIGDMQRKNKAEAIHTLLDKGYTKILPKERISHLIEKAMSK